MEISKVEHPGAAALDSIARDCGAVTVGCSDVAGIVQAVITSRARLQAEHATLRETVAALEADEKRIADACDESRVLSNRALNRLNEGSRLIHSSLGQVTELPSEVMIATQQRMFARRNVEQRPCDIELLHAMFNLTRHERQLAGEPLAL